MFPRMSERKKIREEHTQYEDVLTLEAIEEAKGKYAAEGRTLVGVGLEAGYEDTHYLTFVVERDETDEERQLREVREQQEREEQERRELETLRRLSKKYEGQLK